MKKSYLKKAWLITWEGTQKKKNKIVSFFSTRKPDKWVKDYLEIFYMEKLGSLNERISFAKNKKDTPYRAEKAYTIGKSGKKYLCFTCGHNPHLFARHVFNLTVSIKSGREKLDWEEHEEATL
jgi:hypothetical protein